jgi:hypothetical protein
MQFDIPKFNDPVAALRDDVRSYLAKNNVKQKALASLAGTTEQTISDFLGKRERGLLAETFARLTFIVNNGVVPNSNRIVNLQENGRKVGKSMQLDEHNMTATYARHNNQLLELRKATGQDHNRGTFEINRSNTKNLSK